jgi:hypothetical protein
MVKNDEEILDMSRVRTEATEEWCIKYSEQINLDEISGLEEQTRGIYGFFILDSGKSKCVYIGKAIDIKSRVLEHLTQLKWMQKEVLSTEPALHIKMLNEALREGKKIDIKVLEKVPYEYEEYARDLHHLAYVEYSHIEKYQMAGECLYQFPEGAFNLKEYDIWLEKKKNRSDTDNGSGCNYSS